MRPYYKCAFSIVLGLVTITWVTSSWAQEPKTVRVVSSRTYRKVLDLVFPRDVLDREDVQYAFVIRYEPTWKAESQITVTQRAGAIEVVEYTSVDGNIELKLEEILHRTGREDPGAMARRIRIRRRVVNLPSETYRQMRSNFFESLRSSIVHEERIFDNPGAEVLLTMDGTGYRLWHTGGGARIEYELGGTSIESSTRPDEDPLMEWMKELARQVRKAPTML